MVKEDGLFLPRPGVLRANPNFQSMVQRKVLAIFMWMTLISGQGDRSASILGKRWYTASIFWLQGSLW